MARMEEIVVIPRNPFLYKRYIDDIFTKRVINENDELFNALNNFHPSTKLTIECNPTYFLDTEIKNVNGQQTKRLYRKETKLPFHFSSNIPKRYKRNNILTELNRAAKISDDFQEEIKLTRKKFYTANYPKKFVDDIVNNYQADYEFIIPPDFFKEDKQKVIIELPYSTKNENIQSHFLTKLNNFTGNKFKIQIIWKTRKIKSLFKLKDKINHPASIIYKGVCTCGENYAGETVRNALARWDEHNDVRKLSEPARHLKQHSRSTDRHVFNWSIIRTAPKNDQKRKVIEALIIAIVKPKLNNQVRSKKSYNMADNTFIYIYIYLRKK